METHTAESVGTQKPPQQEAKGDEDKRKSSSSRSPTKAGTSTSSSPPSSTSSPSHEFSFTISLHPSSSGRDKRRAATPASFAIDLSPADDIFFHGHLLPLHLISHPSISPRSSTTSLDNLSLPIRELFDDDDPKPPDHNKKKHINNSSPVMLSRGTASPARGRTKPNKSFSLFRLSKWRKPLEIKLTGDHHKELEEDEKKKKAAGGFDIGRAIKRYVRVVRPFFLFRGDQKEKGEHLRWHPHSFSGTSTTMNSRWKEWGERRRRGGGQFSAPASMRTSPTNSGLLVATATISSSNDSTMEELQSAIQAAIAHCKNSIAAKEETCKL